MLDPHERFDGAGWFSAGPCGSVLDSHEIRVEPGACGFCFSGVSDRYAGNWNDGVSDLEDVLEGFDPGFSRVDAQPAGAEAQCMHAK